MKRHYVYSGLSLVAFTILLFFINTVDTKETIIFFPIDETIVFQTATTAITFKEGEKEKEYILDWRTHSELEQKAYLRQDIGFLFKNGSLVKKLGDWKPNTRELTQESRIMENSTAKYGAVTFHYAEIHGENDQISSVQDMSSDFLYTVSSPYSPLRFFKIPSNNEETKWKELLEQTTHKKIEQVKTTAINKMGKNLNDFSYILLTDLPKFRNEALPGYDLSETKAIIGRLWEGLYKNYFHGIKKQDGTVIPPINSTVPILAFSKEKPVLYILTQTSDGEVITLVQQLPTSR